MKSLLNYQVLLSNVARKQYKLHNNKREWKAFILFVFLIKMITWAVSMYAGFYFFKSLIFKVSNNLVFSTAISVLILFAIEGSTNIALTKLFKFLFRGTKHLSTTIAMFVLVFMLFGVSFISSTNGLSMRQKRKVDNSKEIIEKFESKKEAIKQEYEGRIADIDNQIYTIKANPQGWQGGKRTILMTWQLNKIDSLLSYKSGIKNELQSQIAKIEKAKEYQLSTNNKVMTAEADKYYNIIMGVMIVQFITSAILMFFWKIIYSEDNEADLIAEDAKEVNEIMRANAYNMQRSHISEVATMFAVQMNAANKQTELQTLKEENENEKRTKIAGFVSEKPDTQPDTQPSQPLGRPSKPADFKNEIEQKNIEYLKRHKDLIATIKQIKKDHSEAIKNAEIKRIQEMTKAEQKGRSLIRKVYMVALAVGLENIDEKGNINVKRNNNDFQI